MGGLRPGLEFPRPPDTRWKPRWLCRTHTWDKVLKIKWVRKVGRFWDFYPYYYSQRPIMFGHTENLEISIYEYLWQIWKLLSPRKWRDYEEWKWTSKIYTPLQAMYEPIFFPSHKSHQTFCSSCRYHSLTYESLMKSPESSAGRWANLSLTLMDSKPLVLLKESLWKQLRPRYSRTSFFSVSYFHNKGDFCKCLSYIPFIQQVQPS